MKPDRDVPKPLRDWLMSGHNKKLAVRIADWIGDDESRFKELIGLMVSDDPVLSARAAWVSGDCVTAHPDWLPPVLPALLGRIERSAHPAVSRHLFQMLQTAPIPGELEGRILSAAMAALGAPVPVTVKVYAMTVLKRLAAGTPELLAEIRLRVLAQLHDASPAFRSRARREFGISSSDAG